MKLRHYVMTAAALAVAAVSSFVACVPKGGSGTNTTQQGAEAAPQGGNVIKNADFEDGTSLPWTTSFTQPATGENMVKDGASCLRIDVGGKNPWDAQVRHREMVIQQGHTYTIAFKIWADKPTTVRAKVGMAGPPYAEYWRQVVNVTTEPQVVRGGFIMNNADDPTAEFALHMGGNMLSQTELPVTVCIDDVYMSDPQYTPPPEAVTPPRPQVRVNQVGYFPGGPKIATAVNEASTSVPWQLLQGGTPIADGQTEPFGLDTDSGEHLHIIDFSKVKQTGSGFVIVVGETRSPPFEIGTDLYEQMKYDALKYFYHNRSGIEIKQPYVSDAKWERPAGHAASDKAVPCSDAAGCKYTLDVTGGWYDAGDHGKYVVNGGISVWTMMNQYERFKTLGSIAPFADGKLNIPESGNGVPDILDEARWQMEFMLKMQVPNGKPHAGMAHHKIHDVQWTALGIAPHDAEKVMKRFLRPVSTAATLNLAATGAMCSRLYAQYDPAFSKKCLEAAERAWVAAKQHPAMFAPAADTNGGGPYNDDYVGDDFFWAAAELWIATKNPQYKQELTSSKHWKTMTDVIDNVPSAMNWAFTDALGTISLSLVPGALSTGERATQQSKIVDAAERYLQLIKLQGYRMPFGAGDAGTYPWGSNSFIINNMMILGYAYDFTKQEKYLDGMVLGMDYLLGRNAMAQSYVSGYGDFPLKHPHHRFWSKQYDAKFPDAPAGALSGGPNSGLQDPYVKAAGLAGCQPQKCFVDNIEAWSVNEITVNWNAPFAWAAAYLDEKADQALAR